MFDRSVIDQFEAGGSELRKAVAGLSREQLLAHPVAGTWSIQEIIIHLMDSDLIGVDRMKRVAAEHNPLLIGYNESEFINKLHPELQDAQIAIDILDLNRKLFAKVLRALPDATFEKAGIHNEVGRLTLATLVTKYVGHLNHHLKFISDKRKLVEASIK